MILRLASPSGVEPFHGEWVYEQDGIERNVITVESRKIEMRQRNAEGELRWHWRGTHSIEEVDADQGVYEGTIIWKDYYEFETGKWESWDFTNDHRARLVLEGDSLRISFHSFGEWNEAEYSPMTLRE